MDTPDPLHITQDAARRAAAVGRAAWRWVRAPAEGRMLIAFCAVVRLLAMWSSPAVLNDSVSLLRAAARTAAEGTDVLWEVPHHPLPVAVFALAGEWFDPLLAASLLCAVGSALAVWPLHALARRACGRHAALAACVLYAVLPKAVAVGAVPLAEGIALPFLLGALALAAGARDASASRTLRRLIGAGLLAGCAYLCRPEALIAFPAALAAAALDGRPGKLRRAALVSVGFLLLAVPYVSALSTARGHFSITPKKDIARFVGASDTGRTAPPPPPVEVPGANSVHESASLAEVAGGTASAIESALTLPVVILVLLGALSPRRWRRKRSRRPRLLLAGTAVVLIALVARLHMGWGYGGGRHALAAAVLLLPFAGAGLAVLGSMLPRVTTRRRFLFVTSVALAMPLGARAVLRPPGEGGAGARELGEALAAEIERTSGTGTDVAIASSAEPLVAFYADRVLGPNGGAARDVPLWGRFVNPLAQGADADEVAAAVVRTLAEENARFVVLDVVDENDADLTLLRALRERGAIRKKTIAAGAKLAAIAVAQSED